MKPFLRTSPAGYLAWRIFLCLLLVQSLSFAGLAEKTDYALAGLSQAADIKTMFDAETNSMVRHKIIKQLPAVLGRFGIHTPPSWAVEMLDKALGDVKAGVAETAAREIGDLGVQSLTGRLLGVYNTAPAKYSFSAGIRNGIIYALGKINDNQCKVFFIDMLSVKKRYAEIHEALDAVGSTKDASYVPHLQSFIDDRQAIVEDLDARNDRSDAAELMREQLRHAVSIMGILRG